MEALGKWRPHLCCVPGYSQGRVWSASDLLLLLHKRITIVYKALCYCRVRLKCLRSPVALVNQVARPAVLLPAPGPQFPHAGRETPGEAAPGERGGDPSSAPAPQSGRAAPPCGRPRPGALPAQRGATPTAAPQLPSGACVSHPHPGSGRHPGFPLTPPWVAEPGRRALGWRPFSRAGEEPGLAPGGAELEAKARFPAGRGETSTSGGGAHVSRPARGRFRRGFHGREGRSSSRW